MEDTKPSKDDILECLLRSGYLLETRLVKALNEDGFFVDPNQVIKDQYTGKSREIDIVTEYYNHVPGRDNICVKTHFVIEAINNLYPLILTTKRPFSPNNPTENYVKYWATPVDEPFGKVDIWEDKDPDELTVYSQYCAITKKGKGDNSELMASHPDDLYSSISKMVQYCENELNYWNNRKLKNVYWRVFFWQPVLVVQNELLVLNENSDSKYELVDIDCVRLEFNYHSDGEPSSIIIDVVTEKYMLEHLKGIVEKDAKIEDNLAKYRAKST